MSRFGPTFYNDGTVEFRIWAPRLESLSIRLLHGIEFTSHGMTLGHDGLFQVRSPARPGMNYWIELPDGTLRPDPSSRFQPQGVHGPSQLINTSAFQWNCSDWHGVPKRELILYEMHVGTFTLEGTYIAAIERLDELREVGVTAIELMPLNETAGSRNWGYDGVNLFAPRNSYGLPEELKRFVDAAHSRGLAVILDVVYNHFGPEGNYLHEFGGYISNSRKTVWGDAPNFDGDGSRFMRDFIIGNALYWLEEYRFDGLRLDAIHCILDNSTPHIVTEIGQAIDSFRVYVNREICLIAESNVYDPEILTQLSEKGHGFDAAWCDDFLHSVYAVLRPGQHMSQRQYQPHSDLDVVLRRGFVFQGTLSMSRRRIPLEPPSAAVRLESLVFAIQNHDFIGNHPHGLRLDRLTSRDAHLAAAALLILHPAIPMLFMGEEFASPNPFLFFVDFSDDTLQRAVETGRPAEYPQHDWTGVDSPFTESVFRASFIGDAESGDDFTRQWYKDLIQIRKNWISQGILCGASFQAEWDEQLQLARIVYRHEDQLAVVLVRLHSSTENPSILEVPIDCNVILSHNCEPKGNDPNVFELRPFAVLVSLKQSS